MDFTHKSKISKLEEKKEDKSIIIASDSGKSGTENTGEEIIHVDDS